MDMASLLELVVDQPTFLAFVRALQADRAAALEMERRSRASPFGPDAGGWENVTIESFLECAIAWADDSQFGASQGLSSASPWKQFAVFLYAGKIYE
jgi:hypothetical protein